jgi:hypothetical protein
MFIDEIHKFVKFLKNQGQFLKNQGQNIYHSPEQIDDAINRASLDLFRQEEKKFERNQIVTDTLGTFKKTYTPTNEVTGVYDLPVDYVRLAELEGSVDVSEQTLPFEDDWSYCDTTIAVDPVVTGNVFVSIDLVSDGMWGSRKRDKVIPPSADEPIARLRSDQLEVLPSTVTPIIHYLRKPTKAVWGYTTSVDGRSKIFDAGSSTDLEWSEIMHNEIIEKTMSYLGVALSEPVLAQYEKMQKSNNNER